MTKNKEGRRRMSRLDMSSEGGRLLLRDLMNFKTTGYSPFTKESYQSKKFWESRKEFQELPFAEFKDQAAKMATIAIAQMPPRERNQEEERTRRNTTVEPEHEHIRDPCATLDPKEYNKTRIQSLRDTIVAPYPNGDMAIVVFELDGDIDENAFQLQFINGGAKIAVYGRVPRELTSAASLLGHRESRNSFQDADCMLLDQVIRERLKGSEKDENGDTWELREVIDLPFACKTSFFNKHGHRIPSYLLRKNDQGFAWGYFWLVGEHVGKKEEEGPIKLSCKATSDDEDENDDANSSQFDYSIVEIEEMSVQYETTREACMNDEVEELRTALETQASNHLRLKNEWSAEMQELKGRLEDNRNTISELKIQLDAKNKEIGQLQNTNISLQAQILEHLRARNEQDLEIQKVKMSLAAKSREADESINDKIAGLNSVIIELETKLQTQKLDNLRAMNEFEHEKQQMKQSLEHFRVTAESCVHDKITELKSALDAKDGEIGKLHQKIESESTRIQQYTLSINGLQAKHAEKDKQLQKQQKQIQDLESQIKMNGQMHQQRTLEIEKSAREIDEEFHRLKDGFIKKISVLEQNIRTQKDGYEEILESRNKTLEQLQERFVFVDQQCNFQLKEIDELHMQLHQSEKNASKMTEEHTLHLNEIERLTKHSKRQEQYICELQKEVGELRRSKSILRLTKIDCNEEERKREFNDLFQWDDKESLTNRSIVTRNFNYEENGNCGDVQYDVPSDVCEGQDGKNEHIKPNQPDMNDREKNHTIQTEVDCTQILDDGVSTCDDYEESENCDDVQYDVPSDVCEGQNGKNEHIEPNQPDMNDCEKNQDIQPKNLHNIQTEVDCTQILDDGVSACDDKESRDVCCDKNELRRSCEPDDLQFHVPSVDASENDGQNEQNLCKDGGIPTKEKLPRNCERDDLKFDVPSEDASEFDVPSVDASANDGQNEQNLCKDGGILTKEKFPRNCERDDLQVDVPSDDSSDDARGQNGENVKLSQDSDDCEKSRDMQRENLSNIQTEHEHVNISINISDCEHEKTCSTNDEPSRNPEASNTEEADESQFQPISGNHKDIKATPDCACNSPEQLFDLHKSTSTLGENGIETQESPFQQKEVEFESSIVHEVFEEDRKRKSGDNYMESRKIPFRGKSNSPEQLVDLHKPTSTLGDNGMETQESPFQQSEHAVCEEVEQCNINRGRKRKSGDNCMESRKIPFQGKRVEFESCIPAQTIVVHHAVCEVVEQKRGRKRKSAGDFHLEQPIRKSRRLEEKRLARGKPKTD